jgi:hypothetical protein
VRRRRGRRAEFTFTEAIIEAITGAVSPYVDCVDRTEADEP